MYFFWNFFKAQNKDASYTKKTARIEKVIENNIKFYIISFCDFITKKKIQCKYI